MGKPFPSIGQAAEEPTQFSRRAQRVSDQEQFSWLESTAFARLGDEVSYIARSTHGNIGEVTHQVDGLGRHFKEQPNSRQRRSWDLFPRAFHCDAEVAMHRQPAEDLRIVESTKR